MNPKISVIVPVYQAEADLRRCVDSILHQTYKNLEIVLVDDGSKDRSGQICDEYGKTQDNVIVLHKENQGLTAAWKTGVAHAAGELLGFVDSDDYIEKEMYERMQEEMERTDSDIVCCGIHHVFADKSHPDWDDQMDFPEEFYTKSAMKEKVYPVFINDGRFMGRGLQPNRVSKLLKKSLVLNNMGLCREEVTVGEDYQFSFAMFLEADKIAIMKDYLPYYYCVNKGSMTGKFDEQYLDKIKCMKEQLLRISREKNQYDFSVQIWSDFLCLTVLHIKGGVVAQRKHGFFYARRHMKKVCCDKEVREALKKYQMPRLTIAERLFLLFMKYHCYGLMYLSVNLYFR